jgi:hypothetical protein
VFKKGYATRTQWKLGDNSNPSAAYGTTASSIGARTDPSQMPAAGDRVSGPFKLTGLTAQSKGSNVSCAGPRRALYIRTSARTLSNGRAAAGWSACCAHKHPQNDHFSRACVLDAARRHADVQLLSRAFAMIV